MVLSLTDILTTQAVDKPHYSGSSPAKYNRRENLEPAEHSRFKDYLNKPDTNLKDANNTNAPAVNNASSNANNTLPNNDNSLQNSTIITNSASNAKTESLPGNLADDTVPQQKLKLADLYQSLHQLQADGANISDATLKTLDEILPKLADKTIPAGITGTDIVTTIISKIEDSAEGVDDILAKMNFTEDNALSLTAEQLAAAALTAQAASIDISKIASKVIEVAKIEAGKPQIPAANIRLIQIESLSSPNKKRDENGKIINDIPGLTATLPQKGNDNVTNDVIIPQLSAANILNKDIKNISQQKKIADFLADNSNDQQASNTTNIQNNAQNNTVAADIKQVINQAPLNNESGKISNKLDNASSNTLPGISSENFVKFQNLLEDAKGIEKSTGLKMHHAEEVIAQIKFGLNNAGKDDRNISIQLHPKELGKVDINMQIGADGKTHVMIMAENTDTLNMLQKEAANLKDMLTDALKTDSGNLNFSFQEKGADGWQRQFSNNQYKNNIPGINSVNSGEYLAAQAYRYNMIATEGLDIRV